MEILEFTFAGFWHFVGMLVLIVVGGMMAALIASEIRVGPLVIVKRGGGRHD
jgi:hypothetical protein